MESWTYKNGELFHEGRLVAKFLTVAGTPLGYFSTGSLKTRSDAHKRVDMLGSWLAEIANHAEKTGNSL